MCFPKILSSFLDFQHTKKNVKLKLLFNNTKDHFSWKFASHQEEHQMICCDDIERKTSKDSSKTIILVSDC